MTTLAVMPNEFNRFLMSSCSYVVLANSMKLIQMEKYKKFLEKKAKTPKPISKLTRKNKRRLQSNRR